MTGVLAGVFIGGGGTRLGGAAKGMLPAPEGGTLVARWRGLLEDLGLTVVLVGHHPAYGSLALERVADEPPGIGPLGGLVGLLRRAGPARALAVACDMPFVSRSLVEDLLAAPPAPIVAPRREGLWEPLFAVYDAPAVLPLAVARAAGTSHSLQRLLDQAGATELPMDPARFTELTDWDRPEDQASARSRVGVSGERPRPPERD